MTTGSANRTTLFLYNRWSLLSTIWSVLTTNWSLLSTIWSLLSMIWSLLSTIANQIAIHWTKPNSQDLQGPRVLKTRCRRLLSASYLKQTDISPDPNDITKLANCKKNQKWISEIQDNKRHGNVHNQLTWSLYGSGVGASQISGILLYLSKNINIIFTLN